MLPWQLEFQFNHPKNLMQPFPLPDTLNEIITIGQLTLEVYFFENMNNAGELKCCIVNSVHVT